MKKLLLVCIMFLLLAGVSYAATYESVSCTNSGAGIAFTTPTAAYTGITTVTCTLETAEIRFKTDGTAPTSSEGHLLEVGQVLTITGLQDIKNFLCIRTGGTSGVLKCSFN